MEPYCSTDNTKQRRWWQSLLSIASGQNRKLSGRKDKNINQGNNIVNVCHNLNVIFILYLEKRERIREAKKEFSDEYQVTMRRKLEAW